MKVLFTFFLTITFLNLNGQTIEFKLYNCQSTTLIVLKGDSLHFENKMFKPVKFDTIVSKIDYKNLNTEFKSILSNKENEVWLNHCVNDGTNLKFTLSSNGNTKKVFVGNYFDKRLNNICLILNNYLNEIDAFFVTTIPYGATDKKEIRKKIRNQKACEEADESYKNSMLNKWCEIPN